MIDAHEEIVPEDSRQQAVSVPGSLFDRQMLRPVGVGWRFPFILHLLPIGFLATHLAPNWFKFGYFPQYETDWYESPGSLEALLIALPLWLIAFVVSRNRKARPYYGRFERWCLGATFVFLLVVLYYFCEFIKFVVFFPVH